MKKNFTLWALIAALVFAVPLTGCKNNDDDIRRIENTNKELRDKITILETFKTWAESQPGGFQVQIDELEAALAEARELMAGVDTAPELTRRLDELIAGATITIAEIQSKLEDHDEEIEDLWEALELIDGGGDVSSLLQRIADLEDDVEDIIDRLRNLSYGGGGGSYSGPTLAQIEALIDEMIADALVKIVKSVTYIPEFADGAIEVTGTIDALKEPAVTTIDPITMQFLVAPAAGAQILADNPEALSGVLNMAVPRYTRAIAEVEATVVEASAEGEILTVTFELPAIELPEGDLLQIALVVRSGDGNDVASEFVNLLLGEFVAAEPVALESFTQDGQPVTTETADVETLTSDWIAPNTAALEEGQTVRDGFVMLTDLENGVTLDLIGQPEEEWARLSTDDLTITYQIDSQYEWNTSVNPAGSWVALNEVNAVLNEGVVTFPAGLPTVANRVIVKMTIVDSSFADPYDDIFTGWFAVEVPGDPIDLEIFVQQPVGDLAVAADEASVVAAWGAQEPDMLTTGQVAEDTDTSLVLAVDYSDNPDAARLVDPTETYSVVGRYEFDGTAWNEIQDGESSASIDGDDLLTAFGSDVETRVIVAMNITDTAGYDHTVYFAVEVPATLVDVAALNPGATLDTDAMTAFDQSLSWEEIAAGAYVWEVDDPDATATLAGYMDEVSAAGVAPEEATYTWEVDALFNADGDEAPAGISVPTIVDGVIDRNNTVFGASNTGYYLIVKMSAEADNDIDPGTPTDLYFAIELVGGAPSLAGVEVDIADVDLKINEILSSDNYDQVSLQDHVDDPGDVWTDPDDAGNGQDGSTNSHLTRVLAVIDGLRKFDIEEKMEQYYAGADLVVTYEKIGQYEYNSGSTKSWEVTGHNPEAEIDSSGVLTLGETTGRDGSGQDYGDRLVVKVTITLAPGDTSGMIVPSDGLVSYLCVVLP